MLRSAFRKFNPGVPDIMAEAQVVAQALGWPNKSIGLKDILDLNSNPQGWGTVGQPEWGRFKYAHTNPEVSSTGLSTVAAEFYANNVIIGIDTESHIAEFALNGRGEI